MKKINVPVNMALGIVTEVLYALAIMLTGFLICLAFYFKR